MEINQQVWLSPRQTSGQKAKKSQPSRPSVLTENEELYNTFELHQGFDCKTFSQCI